MAAGEMGSLVVPLGLVAIIATGLLLRRRCERPPLLPRPLLAAGGSAFVLLSMGRGGRGSSPVSIGRGGNGSGLAGAALSPPPLLLERESDKAVAAAMLCLWMWADEE